MICRDFESHCQEQLDARFPDPKRARELEAHASACAHCQPIYRKYQLLQQAIGAWTPAPAPRPEVADRLLAAWEAERRPRPRLVRDRPPLRWAAAAALLGLLVWHGYQRTGDRPAQERPAAAMTRPLSDALAEATTATWDLARETSAPAARIGRQVLNAASLPEPPLPWPAPSEPVTDALRSLDEGAGQGGHPLSGTVRSAFSFLLTAPAVGPQKGA